MSFFLLQICFENNAFTLRPSLNEQVKIQVLATKAISQLSYQIFGKGSLVESKTISFDSTKNALISFIPKVTMIPKAHVIIFYLTSDGEMVSDKVDVEFGNELINFVS